MGCSLTIFLPSETLGGDLLFNLLRDVAVYAKPMEQRAHSIKMLFELLNALPSRDRGRQSQDTTAVDKDLSEDVEDAVVDLSGRRHQEDDVLLDDFSDEIDQWVIDAIKSIGLDTAKAVLSASRNMLIEKADLEEDTVDEVFRILNAEFEKE